MDRARKKHPRASRCASSGGPLGAFFWLGRADALVSGHCPFRGCACGSVHLWRESLFVVPRRHSRGCCALEMAQSMGDVRCCWWDIRRSCIDADLGADLFPHADARGRDFHARRPGSDWHWSAGVDHPLALWVDKIRLAIAQNRPFAAPAFGESARRPNDRKQTGTFKMIPKLRCRASELKSLAERYQYALKDDSLLAMRPGIAARGWMTKDELRAVAGWKAPRIAGRMETNSDEYVKEITGFAFRSETERARIEVLTCLGSISEGGLSQIGLAYASRLRRRATIEESPARE
jgi:hypothetical protein